MPGANAESQSISVCINLFLFYLHKKQHPKVCIAFELQKSSMSGLARFVPFVKMVMESQWQSLQRPRVTDLVGVE